MADTGHLLTQAHELVKQHIEYDLNSRPEYIYTARADLEDGMPCSVVRYAYDGVTSRVLYMRESVALWDAAWELF